MDQELKLFGLMLMWLFGMCTGYFTVYTLVRTRENTFHRQSPVGER